MKKIKMFFVAASLVLATVGVLAAKEKFATLPNLYFHDGSNYVTLNTSSIATSILQYDPLDATITNQAEISDQFENYALYTNISGTWYDVYIP